MIPKLIVDPETKLLPFTVRVSAAPPAMALAGTSVLVAGKGLLTVRVLGLEVPPVGAGLKTVIEGVPAVAMSAAVIWAVNWVALLKVVVRALPLN